MDRNLPPFSQHERLGAAKLNDYRAVLISLVDAFEAGFGPIRGERPSRYGSSVPVKVGDPTDEAGKFSGTTYAPPLNPSDDDLDEGSLGTREMAADSSDANDAEVWDLATLGIRLGYQAGTTSEGKPILLVDGARSCIVKITGNASGGGKYNGRIITAGSAAAATGNLAESDFGTVPGADDCLVLNGAEQGKSTHDITAATQIAYIFPGVILPVLSTGSLPVVAINGLDWKLCS